MRRILSPPAIIKEASATGGVREEAASRNRWQEMLWKEEAVRIRGMRIVALTVLTVFAALAASTNLAAGDMPAADAGALWEYVTKTSPYTGWKFWPGKEGMYKGTHPHGANLKLYANDAALEAAKAGKVMPPGAIVLKENYGKDAATLMAVTPMYKVEGYNAEGADWFWAKYGADGKVMKAGKVEGCIKCHAKVKDQNWIFNTVK
jgi:hypothetical protein